MREARVTEEATQIPGMPKDRHIGDGVYVSFDGYQLWLAANDHRNRVIALDPSVLAELIRFAQQINRASGTRHFPVPE
jgi:hypothetical protein